MLTNINFISLLATLFIVEAYASDAVSAEHVPLRAFNEHRARIKRMAITDDTDFTSKHFLIFFFQPWCAECIEIIPMWRKLSPQSFSEENEAIVIAEVEGFKHKNLVAMFQVHTYPKIFFVAKGWAYEFKGETSVEALSSFVAEDWKNSLGIQVSAVKKISLDKGVKKLENSVAEELFSLPPSDNHVEAKRKIELVWTKGQVLQLTDENFDMALQFDGICFVKFYSPYCRHCISLAPIWTSLAAKLDIQGARIAELDATSNKKIFQRYAVNSFPTLLLFSDKIAYEYSSSNRDEVSLLAFVNGGWKTAEIIQPILMSNAAILKHKAFLQISNYYWALAASSAVGVYAAYACTRASRRKKGKEF